VTPAQLSEAVLRSVRQAVDSGALNCAVPAGAGLRRPPHGDADWSTGIALRLAGPAGRSGVEVAGLLAQRLRRMDGVTGVEVRGPGFLNIRLGREATAVLLRELRELRDLREPGEQGERAPAALPEDPARDVRRWAAATGADPAGLLVQRDTNPLFRVRYAHARSRALLRGGRALGLTAEPAEGHLLGHRAERELLGVLAEETKARSRPQRLTTVADAFLDTVTAVSVLPRGEEKPGAVHRARLALAQATGAVLADGLHQLGIGAPDHL
jgi:arginyl-tRNA synthetase